MVTAYYNGYVCRNVEAKSRQGQTDVGVLMYDEHRCSLEWGNIRRGERETENESKVRVHFINLESEDD